MSKIIDISQTLRPGLPVWPGDTAFDITQTWSIAKGSPVTVSKLTLSTHSGTHADSPKHYLENGETSADTPLDIYIGPAVLLDLSGLGVDMIEPQHLEPLLPKTVNRLILKTYFNFPENKWNSLFTAISPNSVDLIANLGCKLIGVDTPSLDPQDSKEMLAHKAVARADMRILEGLDLSKAPAGFYELIALPLKIAGADASPVRAILRPLKST